MTLGSCILQGQLRELMRLFHNGVLYLLEFSDILVAIISAELGQVFK